MRNYRKTPTVFQMEAAECGAASLAMIFACYGLYMPLEQLRTETGVSRDGCNAANIMRAAKRFGLNCRGYLREPEALRKMPMPCIIHWNFAHFVVLEGFRGKYAYINDPAAGRRRLSPEDLDESFTGVVLTFEKTESFQPAKKRNSPGSAVRERLKGRAGVLFKLFYIGLLLAFPGLVLPLLSQVFLDKVLIAGYTGWLMKLLAAMGLLAVLRAGLTCYRSILLQKLRSKMTLMSGLHFLRHMFRLPISFFDQRCTGDLVGRVNDNTEVNEFLAGELTETVLNIFTAVFYLVILLLYSPAMTAIGLAETALLLLLVFLGRKYTAEAGMRSQIAGSSLYGTVCAGIGITDTIKASGAEDAYTMRVIGYQAKNADLEQQTGRFQQIVGAIPDAAETAADIMLLLAGGVLVMRGQLTIGMLAAFGMLFASFSEPVRQLVAFAEKIQTMKADLSRAEDILRCRQEERYDDRHRASVRGKLAGNIELDNVSFGYSTLKDPLIRNFSFSLQSGGSVAFVGVSGSGKSTAAKIVSGLYRPWTGSVKIDGTAPEDIPRETLNASVAVVDQNITLFSGSIRDNLTMWNPAVLEEDMIAAAKDACIHEFIMRLPGGYDHLLSEGAANLSGGQRQRIEIARALTTKPSVLIMDEATSALDPVVEKQILDNIRRRGCTCVIAAHRLSAFRDADKILVMENGQIVQAGTHRELMNEGGIYKELIQNT